VRLLISWRLICREIIVSRVVLTDFLVISVILMKDIMITIRILVRVMTVMGMGIRDIGTTTSKVRMEAVVEVDGMGLVAAGLIMGVVILVLQRTTLRIKSVLHLLGIKPELFWLRDSRSYLWHLPLWLRIKGF
jgi:hypothetical protein